MEGQDVLARPRCVSNVLDRMAVARAPSIVDPTDTRRRVSVLRSIETVEPEHRGSPTRDLFSRGYTTAKMATSAIMNPVSPYPNNPNHHHHPNHPPPPYSHHDSIPTPTRPRPTAMPSPPVSFSMDARRVKDDIKESNSVARLSLPSIHEALRPDALRPLEQTSYAPYPGPAPSTLYPASYTTSTQGPRAYPSESVPRQPVLPVDYPRRTTPPRSAYPVQSAYPRIESAYRPYDDAERRPSITYRSEAPPTPQTKPSVQDLLAPRNVVQTIFEGPEVLSRYGAASRAPAHGHSAVTAPSAPPPPPSPGFVPPSPLHRSYRPQPPSAEQVEELTATKGLPMSSRPGFEPALKRHLDYWEVETSLEYMRDAALRLSQMCADAHANAQRWGRTPSADGNPTMAMCDSMLAEHEKFGQGLQVVRQAVQQQQETLLAEEQSRQQSKPTAEFDHEESERWGTEPREQEAGERNGNKRRGRAAPPGRCHSCNRAETPEWRRGPDGARTLCNACGLHYAKLTRKTASKQSQLPGPSPLRPKPSEEA